MHKTSHVLVHKLSLKVGKKRKRKGETKLASKGEAASEPSLAYSAEPSLDDKMTFTNVD